MKTFMKQEAFYALLDEGIRFPVRVLHAKGIDTGQSCQGGEGHAYDHPTIDLIEGASQRDGFAALSALESYGLNVRDLSLLYNITDGLIIENFWRITFRQAWPERAGEIPIFIWGYEAT